jgi:hypothetical protein
VSDNLLYFETPPHRECVIRAEHAPEHKALVRILRGAEVLREFAYPGYKVWNLFAHAAEIIDDLLGDDDGSGFRSAGTDLLGGVVLPERAP